MADSICMKQFCQYLSIFGLSIIFQGHAHAAQGTLGCGLNTERQTYGGLPEFTANAKPLLGYQCELKPRRSTYLGNWFPSLPHLSFSQTTHLLNNDQSAPEADDYNQHGYIDLAIKRIGDSQLVIHAEYIKSQQALTANEEISFIPPNISNLDDTIIIQKNQQALVAHSENSIGVSFMFPYRNHQPLTNITLQQRTISQPIQANITGLRNRSLYNTETRLTELGIKSQSYHKGFNINWGLALAAGDNNMDSNLIAKNSGGYNEVLSIAGELELYYQYRFTRRWFAFSRWQGNIQYTRQGKTDNPEYRLAESQYVEQRVSLGIGIRFY